MKRLILTTCVCLVAGVADAQVLIKKDSINVSRYVMLVDSVDGTPETAVTITGLDLQYTRNRALPVVKVDATALATTDAIHADNQAIAVDATSSPGLYRVDWPDAAFAAGADKVLLVVSASGVHPAIEEVQLVDFDPQDGVRMGQTALPNAAADAAGGLVISDAGGFDVDNRALAAAAVTNANTVFNTDFAAAYDATNNVWNSSVTHWLGTAAATPTVAGVPEVDATHLLDELLAGHTTAGSLSKTVSDIYDFLNGAPTFSSAMDGQGYTMALASKLDTNVDAKISEIPAKMPSLLVSTTISGTPSAQTTLVLADGPPNNDALNGALIIVTNNDSMSEDKAVGLVKDYDGTTHTVTLVSDPDVFIMGDGDEVDIIAGGAAVPLWLSGP